jgi:capsular polysaccharide biosynthesis protein
MMDETDVTTPNRQLAAADLARVPARRWRLVAATTALVTAAAGAYLYLAPPTYTGTSVVVVRAVVTDPFTLPSGGADRAVNMTAENGIATGSGVIDKVAAATHRNAAAVAGALTVEDPTGGQVMRFIYRAKSESEAITAANTAGKAYLDVRRTMYEAQRTAVVKSYDDAIVQLGARSNKIRKSLPGAIDASTTSPLSISLLDQLRSLNDQSAQLSQQRSKIAAADLTPGSMTDPARSPLPSSRDTALLYLLAGALAGLLAGILAAFMREGVDRRVRTGADAAEVAGVPVLGTVQRISGSHEADGSDMRYLALAVHEWVDVPQPGPLVLLSARADEARMQVSAGLAAALADSGHDVYLGTDRENATVFHNLLAAAQRRIPVVVSRHRVARPAPLDPTTMVPDDLTSLVTVTSLNSGTEDGMPRAGMRVQEAPAPVTAEEPGAIAIGSGSVRLGPLEPESPESVVLLDGPPAREDDRGVLAARRGHALIVVARDRTRITDLTRLVARMRAAGVTPVGVVMTGDRRG